MARRSGRLRSSTSPRVIGRITPWEAIRAICAALSVGNMSAACGEAVERVERGVPVSALIVHRSLALHVAQKTRRLHANRLTNSSAFSATSRQPASIVSACPRPGILTISVTPLLRFCFL